MSFVLTYTGVKKNATFICYVSVGSQAAPTVSVQTNPTIAAGDFQVSTDGGSFTNLTTLPVVTPAGGRAVKITLSASEMNGDNIMVMCVDAAGAQWCDLMINIQTTPSDANLVQIDSTVLTDATLNLKKLNVVNNAGDAAVFSSTGSNGSGVFASGNGTGYGFHGLGGATGHGIRGVGGSTSGNGIMGEGNVSGAGIFGAGAGNFPGGQFTGGTNANGINATGSGSGNGIGATGGATGNGIVGLGGVTAGHGFTAQAVGSGSGINAAGAANGAGINANGNGSGPGIVGAGGTTGAGIAAQGGAASGSGFNAYAVGSGVGIAATGVGGVSLLATQGISGPLDASEREAIGLAQLKMNLVGITGEAAYSFLNAIRYLRNWAVSGSTLTVYKEDGTTPAWTASLNTSALADPVISFDTN